MDASDKIAGAEGRRLAPAADRSRRYLWAIVLLAATIVTVLAFVAYRQPELLVNLMGLRYCG